MSDLLKARFTKLVTDHMTNGYLLEVFNEYVEVIPEGFWTAPASTSGKYHPAFSLGEGGLVRHSAAVLFVAMDLAQLWRIRSGPALEAVVLSAAVHDTYKGGIGPDWEYAHDHAELAAHRLFQMLDASRNIVEQKALATAVHAVADHMSLWGPKPTDMRSTDNVGSVIIAADYTTSLKYFTPAADLLELLIELGYDPTKEETDVDQDRA